MKYFREAVIETYLENNSKPCLASNAIRHESQAETNQSLTQV